MGVYFIVAFVCFLIASKNGVVKAFFIGLMWPVYLVVAIFGVVVLPIFLATKKNVKKDR